MRWVPSHGTRAANFNKYRRPGRAAAQRNCRTQGNSEASRNSGVACGFMFVRMRKELKTPGAALSRRSLLAGISAVGGGLALGFAIPLEAAAASAASPAAPAGHDSERLEITAWILIQPDNTVTIRIANSEMGQG